MMIGIIMIILKVSLLFFLPVLLYLSLSFLLVSFLIISFVCRSEVRTKQILIKSISIDDDDDVMIKMALETCQHFTFSKLYYN
jgi:hypothetical protein